MIRDWLLNHAEEVTRVAVWIICLLGGAVAFVVLAGLVVALRPETGYAAAMTAMAITYLHVSKPMTVMGRSGRPVGAHRMAA